MGGYIIDDTPGKPMSDAYDTVIRAFDEEIKVLKRRRFMTQVVKRLEAYKTKFENACDEVDTAAVVMEVHQCICKEHRRALALQIALISFAVLALVVGVATVILMPFLAAPLHITLAIVGFNVLMGLTAVGGVTGIIQTTRTKAFSRVSSGMFSYFEQTNNATPTSAYLTMG